MEDAGQAIAKQDSPASREGKILRAGSACSRMASSRQAPVPCGRDMIFVRRSGARRAARASGVVTITTIRSKHGAKLWPSTPNSGYHQRCPLHLRRCGLSQYRQRAITFCHCALRLRLPALLIPARFYTLFWPTSCCPAHPSNLYHPRSRQRPLHLHHHENERIALRAVRRMLRPSRSQHLALIPCSP